MCAEKETWPEFLQRLATLRYRIWRPDQKATACCELFLVDLSEWRLRLSDETPLIWVRADTANRLSPAELIDALNDVARQQGWRHRECLVLLDGPGAEVKHLAGRQYFPRLVIIDHTDQRKILSPNIPSLSGALLDLICEQIPLSSLAPYEISRPVWGSGFFGRQAEIDRILRQDSTNFAILGIRRIGKTSLLTEVYRRLLNQGEEERVVWLDCSTLSSPDEFVREIVRRLHDRELPRLQHRGADAYSFYDFLRRMPKMHGGRITILLDEFDKLLQWERVGENLLAALRDAARELPGDQAARYRPAKVRRKPAVPGAPQEHHAIPQQCRLIIAGFRRLMTELHNQLSPLFLTFEPIHLKPFSWRETEEIVTLPMQALRVRIEDERKVVSQIHADTRGHPLLVQYYCRELIDGLAQRGSRTLGPADLFDIYRRDSFRSYLLTAFRDNLHVDEKLLVYVLLLEYGESKETFTQEEMHAALQRRACAYSPEWIDRTCDNLVWAGVLERDSRLYRFALPVLPRMLRANYNLEHLLAVARKEVNP